LPRTPYRVKEHGYSPRPILFYNWPKHPESIKLPRPDLLLDIAQAVAEHAKSHLLNQSSQFSLPQNFGMSLSSRRSTDRQVHCTIFRSLTCGSAADAAYGILYPDQGKFGAHLDGATGWVINFAIGDAATFFYGCKKGMWNKIIMNSGDVVIFRGGKLWHGVEPTQTSSAPGFWQEDCEFSVFQMSRFSLQVILPVSSMGDSISTLKIKFDHQVRDSQHDRLLYDPQFPENGQTGDSERDCVDEPFEHSSKTVNASENKTMN
jgi:hypothetical protein